MGMEGLSMTAPTKICVPVTPEFLPVLLERLRKETSVPRVPNHRSRLTALSFGVSDACTLGYESMPNPMRWYRKRGATITTPEKFVKTVAEIWPKEEE
jgi:hypothetical protein